MHGRILYDASYSPAAPLLKGIGATIMGGTLGFNVLGAPGIYAIASSIGVGIGVHSSLNSPIKFSELVVSLTGIGPGVKATSVGGHGVVGETSSTSQFTSIQKELKALLALLNYFICCPITISRLL